MAENCSNMTSQEDLADLRSQTYNIAGFCNKLKNITKVFANSDASK